MSYFTILLMFHLGSTRLWWYTIYFSHGMGDCIK